MRLRNSHSSHACIPGVTTRNSPSLLSLLTEVVSFPGTHFLTRTHTHTLTHGTGVIQHLYCRGMLSYHHFYSQHVPLCKGYLCVSMLCLVSAVCKSCAIQCVLNFPLPPTNIGPSGTSPLCICMTWQTYRRDISE